MLCQGPYFATKRINLYSSTPTLQLLPLQRHQQSCSHMMRSIKYQIELKSKPKKKKACLLARPPPFQYWPKITVKLRCTFSVEGGFDMSLTQIFYMSLLIRSILEQGLLKYKTYKISLTFLCSGTSGNFLEQWFTRNTSW